MKFSFLIFVACGFLFFSNLFSEYYVEIYGGACFGKVRLSKVQTKNTYHHEELDGCFHYYSTTKSMDPRFSGGLKLGSWFSNVNSSNTRAKYFGCCLDSNCAFLNYHLYQPKTSVSYTEHSFGPAFGTTDTKLSSNGFLVTTSLLLTIRFGAFPTPKHCFGVLQPYFALGPALVIIRQHSSLWIASHIADGNNLAIFLFKDQKIRLQKKTFLAPALTADIGFRFMISQKVFLDTIFKYCYSNPSFRITKKMNFHPQLHLLSCHLGLGYCF